jgi:hypothetical protein
MGIVTRKEKAYRSADVANDAVILGYLQVLHISAIGKKNVTKALKMSKPDTRNVRQWNDRARKTA